MDDARLCQLQGDATLQVAEERNAGAQQDRVHVEVHLVDDAGLEDSASTHEADPHAGLPLELLHKAARVGGDELRSGGRFA